MQGAQTKSDDLGGGRGKTSTSPLMAVGGNGHSRALLTLKTAQEQVRDMRALKLMTVGEEAEDTILSPLITVGGKGHLEAATTMEIYNCSGGETPMTVGEEAGTTLTLTMLAGIGNSCHILDSNIRPEMMVMFNTISRRDTSRPSK